MPTASLSQVLQKQLDNQQNPPPQTSKPPAELWQNVKPAPTCEICGDTGVYRLDLPLGHPQFGRLIRCKCKAQEDAQRQQRLSGLSERERRIRLADIDTSRPGTARMVAACHEFLARPSQIVTIYGGPGTGKTTALMAVINHSREAGKQAVYVRMFDLIAYIQAGFRDNEDDNYSRLIRYSREIEILAIDEFDKVSMTEWQQIQISALMEDRQRLAEDGQVGTLIAMNGEPANLPDWIYSRLRDGRNQIVNNTDNDVRPLFQPYLLDPRTGEFVG